MPKPKSPKPRKITFEIHAQNGMGKFEIDILQNLASFVKKGQAAQSAVNEIIAEEKQKT